MATTKTSLPSAVLATLWSYDKDKLDLGRDKRLIVGAVLNCGTQKATDWLFRYYGKAAVAEEAEQIPLGAWDKRSLALWSTVLDINPRPRLERFPQ